MKHELSNPVVERIENTVYVHFVDLDVSYAFEDDYIPYLIGRIRHLFGDSRAYPDWTAKAHTLAEGVELIKKDVEELICQREKTRMQWGI